MHQDLQAVQKIVNIQMLNRKFYSYAFMKIMLYQKEEKSFPLQKIRHYDIQCQASNRIADILKEKINSFKMFSFLKLKFQKGTYLVRKNKHNRELKKSMISVKNNAENPQIDCNYPSKLLQEEKKCSSLMNASRFTTNSKITNNSRVTINSKIKNNSSRQKLVKPKNYESTNKHAQKISKLLDKARFSIQEVSSIISNTQKQQVMLTEIQKQNSNDRKKRKSEIICSSTKQRKSLSSVNSALSIQNGLNQFDELSEQQICPQVHSKFARLSQKSRFFYNEFKNLQNKFI